MPDTKSAIIRWRRHTWRSRLASYLAFGVMVLCFLWMEATKGDGGPPVGVGAVLVFGMIGVQRYARRWQVEVISPRPQTREHKRAYRWLQIIQLGFLAAFAIPFFWLIFTPESSSARPIGAVAVALGLLAYLISQPIMVSAYQRLFRRIAATEGAYGF